MAWRLSPLLSLLMFQYFHKPLTDKLQYFDCNPPDWAEFFCHCLETRDGDVGGYANLGKDCNCCGAYWGNVRDVSISMQWPVACVLWLNVLSWVMTNPILQSLRYNWDPAKNQEPWTDNVLRKRECYMFWCRLSS
jgi:hypothetical protein